MVALENTLNELVENGIISHVAVRVGMVDEILYDTFRGNVDENTLFDMASVTKVIVTTTLALIGLDKGLISLDDQVPFKVVPRIIITAISAVTIPTTYIP